MFAALPTAATSPVRRWTALASFTLQAAIVAVALVYPLLHPEVLPRVLRPVSLPLSNFGDAIPARGPAGPSGQSVLHTPIVVNNTRAFTFSVSQMGEATTNPPGLNDVIGPNGPGLLNSIISENYRPMPQPPAPDRTARQSVMMEGNLIHKVEPQYPPLARHLHIAGAVIVRAIISRQGAIERTEVERGQPLLVQAALAAVKQWRYRPYYLNGEPIEVETEITINFVIQR